MAMTPLSGDDESSGIVAEINITPLTDIFLVLLIIFMISAPMLKSAYDISLPQSKQAQPTAKEGIEVF